MARNMKKRLLKIYDSLNDDFNNQNWMKFALKILGLLIAVSCLIFVIGVIILNIAYNIEAIMLLIGFAIMGYGMISEIFSQKAKISIPQETSSLEYDPTLLEKLIQCYEKLMYNSWEIAEIAKLRRPVSLSQMDAPVHYDIISKVPIYHFLVLKQSRDIDPFCLTGILQNAIEQKINNHELDGISQTTYFYNGQIYPILMVDNVRDLGQYVQIDMAIVNDFYCKYRNSRIYNSMNYSNNTQHTDKDF